jgi:hypothetical protein
VDNGDSPGKIIHLRQQITFGIHFSALILSFICNTQQMSGDISEQGTTLLQFKIITYHYSN